MNKVKTLKEILDENGFCSEGFPNSIDDMKKMKGNFMIKNQAHNINLPVFGVEKLGDFIDKTLGYHDYYQKNNNSLDPEKIETDIFFKNFCKNLVLWYTHLPDDLRGSRF